MRYRPLIGAALTLALAACSSDDPVSPPPPPGNGLGTPLTGAHAIEAQSPLLWSAATDEVIAVASFNDPNPNSLIAVHSATGVRRQLEPLMSTSLSLAPGGGTLYYVTLDPDSTVARRLPLAGGGGATTLNRCSGCFHVVLPTADPDVVAIHPVNDSTALLTIPTGAMDTLASGYPVAVAPDASRLLVKELFEALQDARIHDVAAGTTLPANLGLPPEIGDYLVRWDATGIHVLYQTVDRKQIVRRDVGPPGSNTVVFDTPDTLEAQWDWNGQRIAVWTSKAAGAGRSYTLRVIHGDAGIGGVNEIATTTLQPGRPVLPPGGADEVVYVIDRRMYHSAFTPPEEGVPN